LQKKKEREETYQNINSTVWDVLKKGLTFKKGKIGRKKGQRKAPEYSATEGGHILIKRISRGKEEGGGKPGKKKGLTRGPSHSDDGLLAGGSKKF